MRNPSYTVICAVGAILCLLPLPWHWKARNASTLIYLGWVSTACLVCFINSLLWAGNVEDKAPIWCDICLASRYLVCLNVGITSAGLCIQRRLYRVATLKEVTMTDYSKKRELIINLLLGLGLPALMLPFYYVIQPVRYLIMEDIGCWPGTYPTTLVMPLVHIWPVLVTSASCVYAALTIRAFFQTRRQFSKVLSESGAGLNLSRFFRLMALAAMDMACGLPLSLYILISDPLYRDLEPWPSWAVVHEYDDEVGAVMYEDLRSNPQLWVSLSFNLWSIPGCAFLFFMFFGLSAEAMKQYKRIFWRLVIPFGFKPPITEPRIQTVDWTRRLASGTATTLQDNIAVPSPIYSTQSRAETDDGIDKKRGFDAEGGAAAPSEPEELKAQVGSSGVPDKHDV